MTQDRTIKFLLATIALALWGFLLRPLLTSAPVLAAPASVPQNSPAIAMETGSNGTVFVVDNHVLYHVERYSGKAVIQTKIQLR